jgi:hypothetical protein
MNEVKKIYSFIIVLVFLVSATGVYYVKHTCLHSGGVSIILDEKHDCHDMQMDKDSCCDHREDQGKCPVHRDHQNCCVNDYIYLKGNSDYQKSESNFTTKAFDYKLIEYNYSALSYHPGHTTENSITPPLFKFSREVLMKNNILIL